MPDPAVAPVVETPAPAPANGKAPAPAKPSLADVLRGLSPADVEEAKKVFADLVGGAVPKAEAKPEEKKPEADPHPMPDGLVALPTKSFQWTPDCWRGDTYAINGETHYRPILHGVYLAADTRPAVPALIFALWEPLRVMDRRGKIVEAAPDGSVVLVDATPSLLTLLDTDVSQGCPHVAVRPTRSTVSTSGAEVWFFDVQVEPDRRNPQLPKLYTRESALGKRGVKR